MLQSDPSAQSESVMLLRFVSNVALDGALDAATLYLHVDSRLGPIGTVELHLLDTASVWEDGNANGMVFGQPTWDRVASGDGNDGGTLWADAMRGGVPHFGHLRDGWPAVLPLPDFGVDDVLALPIAPSDLQRLAGLMASPRIPLQFGVTVVTDFVGDPIEVWTWEAGMGAELELFVCD
ncbi:MAG: hypothetical protein JKY37_05950 [Nannocystaceae bacterium]|nr:hypothetical protein [Nannocystaceae bacterium]